MADEQLRQQQIPKQQKNIVQPEIKTDVSQKAKPLADSFKRDQAKAEDAEEKVEEQKKEDIKEEHGEAKDKIEKKDEKEKPKPKIKTAPKVKRDYAIVNGRTLPISLKHAKAIGKFIKGMEIQQAVSNLEKVILKKIAVPMKGELAHRKGKRLDGKGMTSGKYPVKASQNFIKLLKTLNANSIVNGMELENTKITEVIANKAPDRMHRFGRMKFKQTHVMIKAMEVKK